MTTQNQISVVSTQHHTLFSELVNQFYMQDHDALFELDESLDSEEAFEQYHQAKLLSNGAFFMVPDTDRFYVYKHKSEEATVSRDAKGIIATLLVVHDVYALFCDCGGIDDVIEDAMIKLNHDLHQYIGTLDEKDNILKVLFWERDELHSDIPEW